MVIALGATVGLIAAIAAAGWASRPDAARKFPLHDEAAQALADDRPFEARLSGSRRWSPCAVAAAMPERWGTACETARVRPERRAEITRLAVVARAALAGNPGDGAWATAILDLVSAAGREATLQRTIGLLRSVAARDSGNAAVLNDLAVAYLAHGAATHDATSLYAALDAVERAAAIDTAGAVVAFNRALILERLFLDEEAEAAWSSFLRIAPEGGWADEARRRAAALARSRSAPTFGALAAPDAWADSTRGPSVAPRWRAAAQRDPQGAREYVLDVLLPTWARAVLAADGARAAEAVDQASIVGAALATRSGDSSVALAARVAVGAGGVGGQAPVARAVTAYAAGAADFRRGAFEQAEPALERAASSLRAAGAGALAGWADLLLAATDIYRGDYQRAESRFAGIAHQAHASGAQALEARALWGLALSNARRGHTAAAAERFAAAAAIFARIGEASNHASMQSQLGDVLLLLGRDDAASLAKLRAFAAFHARRDAGLRHGPLLDLGRQLTDGGLPAAGVAALREAVRSAEFSGRPKDRPEALIRRGRAEGAAGRSALGRQLLAEARASLAAVDDPLMRDRLGMEVAAAEAALLTAEPSVALARLTEVHEYYRRQHLVVGRAPNLVRRADVRLRLADTAGARRDLDAAAATIEAQTASADADPVGARDLVATRRDIYRALVAISVARHDTAGAFTYAERRRAAHPPPGDPTARPALGPGTVVVVYAVLREETILWTIAHREARHMVRIPVGAEALRGRVEQFERLIRRGEDSASTNRAARELYDLLLGPASRGRAVRELVVVPDGVLGRLPFAALRDPTGRYLVESTTIRYASSVAAAVRRRDDAMARRARGAAVLLIGNPAFDRGAFPALEPLRSAEQEVARVRAAYPEATLLHAGTATKRAVAGALSQATLMHFVGHAQLVERVPALSHLVLARDGGGLATDALSAAEIARLDLRRLRLAVLSSCGTVQARSRRDDTEGGLAEAFLDAGAGAVISSLWEVDDAATAGLMGELHRALTQGASGAGALREAQLHALRAGGAEGAARVWSTFRYDGG